MPLENSSLSDDFFYNTLNTMNAHLAILDETGKVIFTNTAWQNFAKRNGYEGSNYGLGLNYLDVCREATDAYTQGALTACRGLERILEGQLNHIEFDYPCPNPEHAAWYKATFSYIENTQPKRILVTHTDSTQEAQILQAYQENRLWLTHTLTSINEGVIVTDNVGLVEFINLFAEELLGYQKEEVLGWPLKQFFNLWDETGETELADLAEQVLDCQEPLNLPHTLQVTNKSGERYYLTCTAAPIRNQNESILGTVITFRDITEQHEAEATIQREHDLLNAILETSITAITLVNTAGQIVFANAQAENILGLNKDSITQLSYNAPQWHSTALDGGPWPEKKYPFVRIMESKKPVFDVRHAIEWPNGERKYLSINGAPLFNEAGDIKQVVFAITDISDQHQAEEKLRQAQKMESLGQMTGGIAHDFNNVLTAIMGHTSLAYETLPPQHPAREDLNHIQKNAERASNLTRQLLTFARRTHIEPQRVNINRLVLNLNKMLRRLISEDIEMSIIPAENLGPIKIDPGQFEQVLVNLVVNARDAMPHGGPLVIRTYNITLKNPKSDSFTVVAPGEYTVLSVTDKGGGMTEAVQERIFEPFFTTKEPGRGTGLGLATCFGIVKQHQGYILVNSQPHQGTTFEVYWPRLNESEDKNGAATPNPQNFQGQERILVVEDESAVRELTRRVLAQQGYGVIEASNGEMALRQLREEASLPDLVIIDMVMPIMGGASLTQILRNRYPSLKILHMSGYIDRPDSQNIIRLPYFIQKPFTPAELLQKVRLALDKNEDTAKDAKLKPISNSATHSPTPGPSRNKSSSE